METVRIDKWLWAARVFKTRTQAADACTGGKVKILGSRVKPSREVKEGDEIEVQFQLIRKILKVKQAAKIRVSAKTIGEIVIDLTPPEETEKLEMYRQLNYERRDRGTGRPTKKERRQIDDLKFPGSE
jgi:ribosome-associated heat shock protein Hsp15